MNYVFRLDPPIKDARSRLGTKQNQIIVVIVKVVNFVLSVRRGDVLPPLIGALIPHFEDWTGVVTTF